MTNSYHICSHCVMDTSDPEITFDEQGVCNHCRDFTNTTSKRWFPTPEGAEKLELILRKIREDGKNKPYDCIIGLSGGVDSSYLALVLKKYQLRPLVVHVDAGWNSETAVHNIERIVKYCDYELHTHVMDWEEIRDLQLAYLKSGVANQDAVQDHAYFATLYHFAVKKNISYVISGGNIATESVFPKSWHHSAMDAINLKAIHKIFGTSPLKHYRTISIWQYYIYYPFIKKMKTVRPLNYLPYNKKEATELLIKEVGYKDYGRKHGESLFTKFFQNHYLPQKFNIDKRRIHLSSQILSGEITRETALTILDKELYNSDELANDMAYVAKKLGITTEELQEYIQSPSKHYSDYPNWDKRHKWLKKIQTSIEKYLKRDFKNYA